MDMQFKQTLFLVALLLTSTASSSFGQSPAAPPPAPSTVDDKSPGWIWDHMSSCDSVSPPIVSAHAGGPGSSGTYLFRGTGITLFGASERTVQVNNAVHRIGKVSISIDGVHQGDFPEYTAGQFAGAPVFTTHSLEDKNHSILVEPIDGWGAISSITIDHSPITAGTSQSNFFDDFSSGSIKAWTIYGGNWVLNGHWLIADAGSGNKVVRAGSQFSNFTYEADIAITGDGDGGLIFRVSSPSEGTDTYNGYYVGLDTDKQAIVLGKAANSWTPLASAPYTIQQNTKYHLRVIVNGVSIVVFVGNQNVLNVSDNSYATGAVGLRDHNTIAGFTNISLKKNPN